MNRRSFLRALWAVPAGLLVGAGLLRPKPEYAWHQVYSSVDLDRKSRLVALFNEKIDRYTRDRVEDFNRQVFDVGYKNRWFLPNGDSIYEIPFEPPEPIHFTQLGPSEDWSDC